jgi:hypothetical protein
MRYDRGRGGVIYRDLLFLSLHEGLFAMDEWYFGNGAMN